MYLLYVGPSTRAGADGNAEIESTNNDDDSENQIIEAELYDSEEAVSDEENVNDEPVSRSKHQ